MGSPRERSNARSCAAAALLISVIPLNGALASECSGPQIWSLPVRDPQRVDIDASLWVMQDNVWDDLSQSECRFVAEGSGDDVAATLVVHPAEAEGADSTCASVSSRFRVIGELIPNDSLVEGVEYKILCGTGDHEREWLHTWLATAEQTPAYESLELVVEDVRRYKSSCTKSDYLRLTFQPIDDMFFESNGLLLVEYGPNRLDVIRGVEQHVSSSIAMVDLPLPEDEEITIRAINGMGAEVGAWTFDVTGLGEDGEGGCRTFGASPGGLALGFLVLFVRRRRRARR